MFCLALVGIAFATVAAHIVLGMASSANYPGGELSCPQESERPEQATWLVTLLAS